MTTAARPTFEPAKGGMGRGERDLSALSKQYSARDLPSHTRLKYRDHGQSTTEELRSRDFRRELEDRERTAARDKRTSGSSSGSSSNAIRESGVSSSSSSSSSKKPRLDQIAPANLDADDPQDDDDDASDSDDSDDEAVLFAELERIRRERAEEEARKQQERQEQEERIRMENIISGNPLLNLAAAPKSDMKVKRRWDDDVVFKNCAASEPDKTEKAFINDSLRSDFHKRFMEKYVK
ncbi:spliceosome-associated protein CWC15 homolog [Procambarus clarkii]|uniref:spliceosome-associated protein CWC15 homolog n=1 Tax=Procambarus clarkii TaxID=6728 RepID=UPI001E6707A6|nr:spliceosome-associated protein CWC15 homolog [Procambarus clarkii]XP_045582310.1 spliceosome-associated protein CWC15 homolog [Procambarus clarkii]XP_045582311.1 spliceosome-associated protein CWC15 homolog [Procambarus clarkii]